MTEKQAFILNLVAQMFESGELDKLIEGYLNPTPLLKFGKANGITYPWIIKSKRFDVVKLFGRKMVIDND